MLPMPMAAGGSESMNILIIGDVVGSPGAAS
jgi:hypothetical protein